MTARAEIYYKIRSLVISEATRPLNNDAAEHAENKKLVHSNLKHICHAFDPDISVSDFWFACWTHYRWAGVRASRGSDDIKAHEGCGVFNNYEKLLSPDWDFPENFRSPAWGKEAEAYIAGRPPYNVPGMTRKRDKLKKTVKLARALKRAVRHGGPKGYLNGMFGLGFYDEIKNSEYDALPYWHSHFCSLMGGANEATAFHTMMDLGLPCVKPDIVLTDLFYRLGWLPEAVLPEGMSREQIRQIYKKPEVYWSMQHAARHLAEHIKPMYGDNPLRELDWIMVKYGQEPEPGRGIARNLDREKPIEKVAREL